MWPLAHLSTVIRGWLDSAQLFNSCQKPQNIYECGVYKPFSLPAVMTTHGGVLKVAPTQLLLKRGWNWQYQILVTITMHVELQHVASGRQSPTKGSNCKRRKETRLMRGQKADIDKRPVWNSAELMNSRLLFDCCICRNAEVAAYETPDYRHDYTYAMRLLRRCLDTSMTELQSQFL